MRPWPNPRTATATSVRCDNQQNALVLRISRRRELRDVDGPVERRGRGRILEAPALRNAVVRLYDRSLRY